MKTITWARLDAAAGFVSFVMFGYWFTQVVTGHDPLSNIWLALPFVAYGLYTFRQMGEKAAKEKVEGDESEV